MKKLLLLIVPLLLLFGVSFWADLCYNINQTGFVDHVEFQDQWWYYVYTVNRLMHGGSLIYRTLGNCTYSTEILDFVIMETATSQNIWKWTLWTLPAAWRTFYPDWYIGGMQVSIYGDQCDFTREEYVVSTCGTTIRYNSTSTWFAWSNIYLNWFASLSNSGSDLVFGFNTYIFRSLFRSH